jgi:hypothetical protein
LLHQSPIPKRYLQKDPYGASMVRLKVRKFGNSLGVVLPKEVINRLHTADGEALRSFRSKCLSQRNVVRRGVFDSFITRGEPPFGERCDGILI